MGRIRTTATVTISRTYEIEVDIESDEPRVPYHAAVDMLENFIVDRVQWTHEGCGFEAGGPPGFTIVDSGGEPDIEIEIDEIDSDDDDGEE